MNVSASGVVNQQHKLVRQLENEYARWYRCLEAQFALAYRFGFNTIKSPDLCGVEIVNADPYLNAMDRLMPLTDAPN